MNVVLFDDPICRTNLLPLTFTRPVGAMRTGIFTIAEKWQRSLKAKVSFSTAPYLAGKFPSATGSDNHWINGAVCPDDALVDAISGLNKEEALVSEGMVIAIRTSQDEVPEVLQGKAIHYARPLALIDQIWKIYTLNGDQIKADLALLRKERSSKSIADQHTRTYNDADIFVEDGVYIRAAILNAETGPIYLGKDSIVQEGAIIRGPFAMGEGSHINMGAKIRGNVSIGPFCKVGGEVSNSVIHGYTNKAHDGFLGCSVIGEWCNLGADTNTSNLKNNYDNVRLWNYGKRAFMDTGLMFCGMMMGDHSKCGINTMFNTGTTVGVCANVFGGGFPRNFVPSFAWGGVTGFTTFDLSKAYDTASRVMQRRSIYLTDQDRLILKEVYTLESEHRVWEKK